MPKPVAASTASSESPADSFAETNRTEPERAVLESYGGVFDEAKRAVVFQRYCHVYQQGELRKLVDSVGGARILSEFCDTGNHCILVQKDDG